MIQQGFEIKNHVPRPWWFMVYYNIKTESDRDKVRGALMAAGANPSRAEEAADVLRQPNTAHIFTNIKDRATIIALSFVTSKVEFFNSISHELQHATAHLCEAFQIPYNGEQAGYIQGEIGEELYEGVAISICPKCNCQRKY